MLQIQNILQNENFILALAIIVPLALTLGAFAIFYFGFRKPKQLDVKPEDAKISRAKELHEELSTATVEPVTRVPQAVSPKLKAASLSDSLSLTRTGFLGRIKNLFSSRAQLSSGELEELEEILYTSDLGPQTVQRLMLAVETKLKEDGASGFESVRTAIKNEMLDIFSKTQLSDQSDENILSSLDFTEGEKPRVLMVVGVNGAGKTTSIGKISSLLAQQNKRVLVAAGDTFRAAAGSQLKIWTDRAQVEIHSPDGVSDPSAVAFGAVTHAKAQNFDVVIVDTAGRLHTQKSLMEELKKMKRVITKVMPNAPHEVLLVLDASSGQNALQQAREFHAALGITGVVLAKLDGTAKGGVALGLAYEMQLPIKLIGVGEGIGDLRSFKSQEFVDSII